MCFPQKKCEHQEFTGLSTPEKQHGPPYAGPEHIHWHMPPPIFASPGCLGSVAWTGQEYDEILRFGPGMDDHKPYHVYIYKYFYERYIICNIYI